MTRNTLLLALLFGCVSFGLQAQNEHVTLRKKMTFPNQTLANIWGYSANGKEYALLGASKGLIIVDVTDPDNPQQIVQVPGPDNLWKEIKTYSHYAYVVSEGGGGVQVIDLTNLPGNNVTATNYRGDGEIANTLNTIHALHIDTTKGYLYAYGSNLFSGAPVVLDIHTDPANPKYVGKFDALGYVHDGYVDNDTLYAGHIYVGLFSIVDMADKSAPSLLGTQSTPNNFTHNTWLGADHKTLFTTDETPNSFLSAYDISDPTNVKFLDKVQSNPGSNSAVHNTHIRGNYAITSWYRDGFTIVDVTKPDNLVQVGNYDTYPGVEGPGFEGCWGVYPLFGSGTIVASNISGPGTNAGELWILTPEYVRASYLQGTVTNADNGATLADVSIEFIGNPNVAETTDFDGTYTTGQSAPGTVTVSFSKAGFLTQNINVDLITGEVVTLDVQLQPAPIFTLTGSVVRADNNEPVPQAQVSVFSDNALFETVCDDNGLFTVPNIFSGDYNVVAGAWGYLYDLKQNLSLTSSQNINLVLTEGYKDDFVFDYGWTSSGTSAEGLWERGVPVGVNVGIELSPDKDLPNDIGNQCYVTGNSTGDVDVDDVESGTMNLLSPVMDLTGFNDPKLDFQLFFTSFNINQQSLDSISIWVRNGITEKQILKLSGSFPAWQPLSLKVKNAIALTENMQMEIRCFDNPNYQGLDSYEAAIDGFKVVEGNPVAVETPVFEGNISVQPNPFNQMAQLVYELPGAGFSAVVTDLPGRIVETVVLSGQRGAVTIGQDYRPGVYMVQLMKNGIVYRVEKVIRF